MTEYNGWSNWETWLIHLWLTNKEGNCIPWGAHAIEMDEDELAEALQDAHEQEAVEVPEGWRRDALLGVVSEVNWREVAAALQED